MIFDHVICCLLLCFRIFVHVIFYDQKCPAVHGTNQTLITIGLFYKTAGAY